MNYPLQSNLIQFRIVRRRWAIGQATGPQEMYGFACNPGGRSAWSSPKSRLGAVRRQVLCALRLAKTLQHSDSPTMVGGTRLELVAAGLSTCQFSEIRSARRTSSLPRTLALPYPRTFDDVFSISQCNLINPALLASQTARTSLISQGSTRLILFHGFLCLSAA